MGLGIERGWPAVSSLDPCWGGMAKPWQGYIIPLIKILRKRVMATVFIILLVHRSQLSIPDFKLRKDSCVQDAGQPRIGLVSMPRSGRSGLFKRCRRPDMSRNFFVLEKFDHGSPVALWFRFPRFNVHINMQTRHWWR
jgi:hypothetical protein